MSLLDSLIPTAHAATQAAGTAGASQGASLSSLLFIAAIFVLFYFMLIRPQQKRQKEHQNLVSSVAKGDEVVTNGGVVGKIVKITDGFVLLSVAEGFEITVQKQAIANTLPKGTLQSIQS